MTSLEFIVYIMHQLIITTNNYLRKFGLLLNLIFPSITYSNL